MMDGLLSFKKCLEQADKREQQAEQASRVA